MRVLFINDVGFQYGAGLAQLRQIQSFLLMGHDVAALCWNAGSTERHVPLVPPTAQGKWLGITSLPYLHLEHGISADLIINSLIVEARLRYPDIIIVGNLHGAKWPTQLLNALKTLACPVIVYMHDCYWLTGRCAYTGTCDRHIMGCNSECPTWEQYPSLEPSLIFGEWLLKREIFCGSQSIPLTTNSQWLQEQTKNAMPNAHQVDCLYLGLDADLFQPIDKLLARQLLGIPGDCFVVLGGSANVKDFRKGGHIFQELVGLLSDRVIFLVFGAQSEKLSGVHSTGLLRDYRKMPLIYSAADVFLSTSLEEAFGQTLCEAAACALPIIAFDLGGIPEIARHGENARLVKQTNAVSLMQEIEFFRCNPDDRLHYGQTGRKIVESSFTLQAQGERWIQYLCSSMSIS